MAEQKILIIPVGTEITPQLQGLMDEQGITQYLEGIPKSLEGQVRPGQLPFVYTEATPKPRPADDRLSELRGKIRDRDPSITLDELVELLDRFLPDELEAKLPAVRRLIGD